MNLPNTIKLATMGFKPMDIKKFNESQISDEEIIKLAENGYSVKDVDELIASAQKESETVQPEQTAPPEQEPASAPDPQGDPASIDYKEKFEAQEEELKKLKQTISTLQNQLTHKNLGPVSQETPRQKFQEALKGLY